MSTLASTPETVTVHLQPASFQVPMAVCFLQKRSPTLSPGSSGSSDPLPGLPQHPRCWTVICLAESVCLWGCNLSRSHQALGERSRFDGSSWPEPFPRGLGDRELLSRGGEAVAVVRPQPSRQSKQVLSSHLPAPAQVVLGATHPVLEKASPSPAGMTLPLSQPPPAVQLCLVAKRTGTKGTHGGPLF